MNKFEAATNIASFLVAQKGSVLAQWSGKLTAKEQREIFGRFLGKGKIWIDGQDETIEHTIKVAFGQDSETTFRSQWSAL